jgi:hypothetical protein
MRLSLFASVVVAAASFCGAAFAQQQMAPTNGNTGGKRYQINLTERVLYDTNVARGQDVIATTRNLQKEEITYSPTATLSVFVPVGQQIIFANISGGYEFRQNNKELEAPRWNASAGTVFRVGPCGLNVNGTYGYSQSDLSTLPTEVTRNRRDSIGGSAQVSCTNGTGLTGFLGGQYGETHNSASAFVVDSNSRSFTAGVGYQNRLLGSLQVFAAYSKSGYDDNPIVARRPAADFETQSVGLQLSRPIGARLNGSATLGYQHAKSDDPLIESSSNFSGSGQLDYRLNSRIGLNLAYDRGVSPSTIAGVDYILVQAISVGGRYSLSSRLSTSLRASWDKTDYKGPGPLPSGIPTNSRTRNLGADVSMKLGRFGSLGINASQTKRQSDRQQFDYTSYQVSASATQSF